MKISDIRTLKLDPSGLEQIEGLSVEYPYVLHRVDLAKTQIPWHWHEEVEFIYVNEGSMRISTPGRTLIFQQGEGFSTNTNVLSCLENEKGGKIDSHLLHETFLSGHFKSIYETKYLDPILKNRRLEIVEFRGNTERQKDVLEKLRQAARLQEEPDTEFQTRNLFSEIWLLLLKETEETEYAKLGMLPERQERIRVMLSFIQKNYERKISLEDIAGAAFVGKRECLRCFQSCMGKTPFDYLLEFRVEMSKKLLRDTKLPVMEIAARTGFSSTAYFGKVFRRFCQMSPREYRRQAEKQE